MGVYLVIFDREVILIFEIGLGLKGKIVRNSEKRNFVVLYGLVKE